MNEPDRPRRDVSIEEAERMPMTDEELDAALRRADKATMGPWVARLTGSMGDVVADYEDNVMIEEITPNIDADDAAFIAHARDDVPALVAELRQVRQVRANLKQMLSQCEGDANRMQALIGRLHGLLEGGLTYNQSELRQDALEMLGLDEE